MRGQRPGQIRQGVLEFRCQQAAQPAVAGLHTAVRTGSGTGVGDRHQRSGGLRRVALQEPAKIALAAGAKLLVQRLQRGGEFRQQPGDRTGNRIRPHGAHRRQSRAQAQPADAPECGNVGFNPAGAIGYDRFTVRRRQQNILQCGHDGYRDEPVTDDDGRRDGKPSMRGLKTRPLARNLALARMGLSTGARIAAHELTNVFRRGAAHAEADRTFYARQAKRLADELGQLKGSVMKVGQMLSLYAQYFLPEEAVTVLAELQDNTPPVEWKALQPVLQRALGRTRLAELDIETAPIASASLGQVHRARRQRDGLALVLKVQYPGVADAIDSDIRTLARLISMTRLAPRGLNLEPVYAEVKEMLHREVDYLAEREHILRYRELLADDARYAIPQVFPEYSSDKVLALSFEPGLNVRAPGVQNLPQARRNAIARAALDLFLTEFFRWGMVQTDPHFGNYRIRVGEGGGGHDQLVLLDFGATRLFGRGFIESYRDMVRGALDGDREATLKGAAGIGLMQDNFPERVRATFAELCELIVEPFQGGEYDWGASTLPRRVTATIGRAALTRWFHIPPREIVFLHRRLAGVFILLATLGAKLDARALLQERLGGR
jgi:predicted unusual protein kinase regulating ubiquinone biosynthesis (AarF/ABC1/UbiB family)